MELLRVHGPRSNLLDLLNVPELVVVRTTAVDRGDGSWFVSVYAPEGAADELRSRGLTVDELKPAEQLHGEWAAAAQADAEVGGYLMSGALFERMSALATANPAVCACEKLANPSHEGKDVLSLRLGAGKHATVVVIGGVHAREWAPPDALLSLAEGLITAYMKAEPLTYPEWIDQTANPSILYAEWTVPADEVKQILEQLTTVIVPLVNPDGRDFSLSNDAGDPADLHPMWRKNRRPPDPGHAGPWCFGVDINRNFDIAWDFEVYYNAQGATEVQSKKDPCDPQIFIGPSAASEPETLNVQSLVSDERPTHFMDVHSYSRDILFPWGMDDDQARDESENLNNPDWDRAGPHGGPRRSWRRVRRVPAATCRRCPSGDRRQHPGRNPGPGWSRPTGPSSLYVCDQASTWPLPDYGHLR